MTFFSKSKIQSSLISSDFYLRKCKNLKIHNFLEFEDAIRTHKEGELPLRIFVDGVVGTRIFSGWNNPSPDFKVEIYIHQGDVIPSEDLMKKMHLLRFNLFSVNWLGDLNICKPLPIGIPTNSFKGIHGTLIHKNISDNDDGKNRERKHKVYVSLNLTTNIIHRKLALEELVDYKETFIPSERLSVKDNLRNILQSKYVVSPPGAGADCYRTWESLYLGATPVVLRNYWSFNHLDLPVKIVNSYSEFLGEIKNDEELLGSEVSANFIQELPKVFD